MLSNILWLDFRLPQKRRLAGKTSDTLSSSLWPAYTPLNIFYPATNPLEDSSILSSDRIELGPSMMLSVLLALLASIICAQGFVITQPDSNGWPRNVGMMTVRWETSPPDPPVFTMLLRDASQSSVVNPLAIATNVPSSLGSFQLNLPTVPVSQTYQILFVDPTNLSRILATSSIFPITNSPTTISSETITRSVFTATLTPSSPVSSTIPPTTSLGSSSTLTSTSSVISSTPSASSTLASVTRLTTSTLGTAPPGTVTVTVTPEAGASFVPINAAERPKNKDAIVGSLVMFMVSFFLGGL
ncbi:hypothetical protein OPQ81_002797 [Rhizoctonia solani]|nr:hypothetical protein OPQ81_002797 [Rhizoctonia solani]